MPEDEDGYSNIRGFLGELIGARVIDISQHDREDWDENHESYVMLMFDNGRYVKIYCRGEENEPIFETNCGE